VTARAAGEVLVDTNLHVIAPPAERERYPLAPMAGTSGEFTEEQSTTVKDCIRLMDDASVASGLLIASRFHGFDNSYCADAVARHADRFVSVANVDVFAPDVIDQAVYWIAARGMHGLRIWSGGRGVATWVDDEWVRPLWQVVRELAVPVNAHTTKPEAFAATLRFIDRFPEIPLTINHLGHTPIDEGAGSVAARELFEMARSGNTWVNLPVSFLARVDAREGPAEDLFAALLDSFGARRMIWSAFFPSEQTRPYPESVAIVRRVASALGDVDAALLLGGAALQLYPALRGRAGNGESA